VAAALVPGGGQCSEGVGQRALLREVRRTEQQGACECVCVCTCVCVWVLACSMRVCACECVCVDA